ncbi:hypothetical protein [Angustibacter luteus]|uniref:Uncharacterized protein n=1 Tax=Angustibacter luteus TaxID=658456 RepID=A0ABW1JB20_9ACTN
MDTERVAALRDALSHTSWWSRARTLGQVVRSTPGPGHLLLVGTPQVEPWHLAAHLDDEARLNVLPQVAPLLVRWAPPQQAPDHLKIGLSRLEQVGRGETVFVVAPDAAPASLLERVDDARRVGATVLSLDAGDDELGALAHERMTVSPTGLVLPDGLLLPQPAGPAEVAQRGGAGLAPEVLAGLELPASFELAQHFVSAASGLPDVGSRPGWRERLGQLIDLISGPSPRQQHRA